MGKFSSVMVDSGEGGGGELTHHGPWVSFLVS